MPVKQVGKKWEVDGEEFKTEAAAENAYKAKLALSFGIQPDEKPKKSAVKKTKKPKPETEDEEEVVEE